MAGIGFEIRKMFGKKTIASGIKGTFYAIFATIGPIVIFMAMSIILRLFMEMMAISYPDKLLFNSSFTYCFLVAIITSSLFTNTVSRYVADKIYADREADISASIIGVLTLGSIISGTVMAIMVWRMSQTGAYSAATLLAYYLTGVLACNVYNIMTYVTAIKEYQKIFRAFLLGLSSTLILVNVFAYLNLEFMFNFYLAIAIGFFIILTMVIYECVKAFNRPSDKIFEFISYLNKYPLLFFTSFIFTTGFYISNIIYWNISDNALQVNIFRTLPAYDLAMMLAIMANLPALVIFVVKIETSFYEKYIEYLSALNNDTYKVIEKKRKNMIRELSLQLFFIYDLQLIFCLFLLIISYIIFPYLGISNQTFFYFRVLIIALYALFSMQFTMIIQYYFVDYKSTFIAAIIYFAVEVILCLIVGYNYYQYPLLVGSLAGWAISFITLRNYLKKVNVNLLCR